MAVPELSAVEQQIVLLVAQGQSRRAIADELGLSLKTVDWHIARGRRKLERAATLHDRMQREADLIVGDVGLQAPPAIDNPKEEGMTKLQPHPTTFDLKAIFALLLAIVVTGAVAGASSAGSTRSPRSGALHVTKECSAYFGRAGDFCTITSSNLNAIKVGSRVVYASAAGDPTPGVLDSELVIDGPGHNTAFGHVVLDLSTLSGVVTFSGGTGEFSHFQAGPLVVACPAFPDCSWDGPYSFSPQD